MTTPQKVKELRDRTGVGMAKCKQALDEVGGDIDLAIDNLRKAGMASAVKKEGRSTNEGAVGFFIGEDSVSLVEINSETDFVAKNEKFRDFLQTVAEEVARLKPANPEELLKSPFSGDPKMTVDQYRSTLIQVLGENIVIKRVFSLPKKATHSYGFYSHMNGKIVCLVELNRPNEEEAAKNVAMHIAAEAPEYLDADDIPDSVTQHEKEIASGQVKGRPEHILEKIVEGKLNAFYDGICLNRQKFVRDPKISVKEYVLSVNKEASIVRFLRWQIGQ